MLTQKEKDKIFDVTNPQGSDSKKFHFTRDDFFRSLSKHRVNVFAKDKSERDAKIINMICIKEGYVLVRAYTYTFNDLDRNFHISSRIPNGIELCLRNKSYIKEEKVNKTDPGMPSFPIAC